VSKGWKIFGCSGVVYGRGVETGHRIPPSTTHTHTPSRSPVHVPPTHPIEFSEKPRARSSFPRGAAERDRTPGSRSQRNAARGGTQGGRRERESNGGGIHPPSCSPLHALSSGLLFVPHSLSREPRVDKGGVKEGRRLRRGSQGKKKSSQLYTHTHTKMHAQGVAGDMKYDGPRSEFMQTAPLFSPPSSGVQG
jgi:hypothetical protein